MYKIDRRGGGLGGAQKSFSRTDPRSLKEVSKNVFKFFLAKILTIYFLVLGCIVEWIGHQPTCPVDRRTISALELKPVPRSVV